MYWAREFDPEPDSGSEFCWTEGNFSCDCNRGAFFADAGGDADRDCPCGDERFHVARAYCADGRVIKIDGESE